MESQRSQLEFTLQAALDQARQAMREVQIIEHQLFEADLQAGRARLIIKKSGFGDVLLQKIFRGITITKSNCASYFLYLTFLAIHIMQLGALQLDLEDLTFLSRWTNLFVLLCMYRI